MSLAALMAFSREKHELKFKLNGQEFIVPYAELLEGELPDSTDMYTEDKVKKLAIMEVYMKDVTFRMVQKGYGMQGEVLLREDWEGLSPRLRNLVSMRLFDLVEEKNKTFPDGQPMPQKS